MYQAPDFVKVSTKVKDVFSGYTDTCIMMNDINYVLVDTGSQCYDKISYQMTWVEEYPSATWQCYWGDKS